MRVISIPDDSEHFKQLHKHLTVKNKRKQNKKNKQNIHKVFLFFPWNLIKEKKNWKVFWRTRPGKFRNFKPDKYQMFSLVVAINQQNENVFSFFIYFLNDASFSEAKPVSLNLWSTCRSKGVAIILTWHKVNKNLEERQLLGAMSQAFSILVIAVQVF